jgi:predicted metalloendopeptidase
LIRDADLGTVRAFGSTPCVDFYAYSCGGWIKHNPISPDQAHWSVYGKLEDENLRFLIKQVAI